jgi:hypothetical protein
VSGSVPNTMEESDEMQRSKKCITELEVFNYVLTQQSNNNFKKKPFDLVGGIKKILPFMSQVQVHFRDAG